MFVSRLAALHGKIADKSTIDSLNVASCGSNKTICGCFQCTQRLNACIEFYFSRNSRNLLLSIGLKHVTRERHEKRETNAALPMFHPRAGSSQNPLSPHQPGKVHLASIAKEQLGCLPLKNSRRRSMYLLELQC